MDFFFSGILLAAVMRLNSSSSSKHEKFSYVVQQLSATSFLI